MLRFYPDYEAIDAFTRSLDLRQNGLACAHCHKTGQWVSHGIVYKQRSMTQADKVGKRLFCSNRYGRSGCGRTVQLYVASIIPRFRYGTAVLCAFIRALLSNLSVIKAYQKATAQSSTRHAWRWLQRMMQQLSTYRCFLDRPTSDSVFHRRSRRLQILLPTLQQINFKDASAACQSFQMKHQQALMR